LTRRLAADVGTGLIGSVFALLAFLALLLFAVQLLMALYTTSVVTSAAHEAARVAASGAVDQRDPAAVMAARARGERRLRQLLGRFGDRVTLDWSSSTQNDVELRVKADAPRFLLPSLGGAHALGHVDRTVRVRVEQLQ
jgi:Flp pilus assembly protein TadG